MSEYYLELSKSPIRFEADNQLTKVFFDDSNKHVFAVRSSGVLGVVVKGPTIADDKPITFRMEDHGTVMSIKFSLDQKILAVQRTNHSVEFMNFNGVDLETEYSQTCKKNSTVLGFVWLPNNEIAFITEHGVELYLVLPEKKSLKHLKTTSLTVQWFVWCPRNMIALLASSHGSSLLPVIFKPGSIVKLSKVEKPGKLALERNVTLATLYGVPSILILRHQTTPTATEVHVHTLNGPGQAPVKNHILKVGLSGRFAVNVVDNLIVVHHQASKSSLIFDIAPALPGGTEGTVQYHSPVVPAKSLKPTELTMPGLTENQSHLCELYSPNWVVFQPNIIIDAILGCLWHIDLCLPELLNDVKDLSLCTQIALKRTEGKRVLLNILLENVKQPKPALEKIQEAFNHINKVYRTWIEVELQTQTASPPGASVSSKPNAQPNFLIDQMDVYGEIFQKLDSEKDLARLEWTLVTYIASLSENGIQPQYNINEMLVTTLVRRKKFTALQQMLQYGVVTDSKPLACLLLSLGNMHPSAYSLALDMLARLDATEEIQEILLSQGQVLSALKMSKENANPRKFLQAALSTGNDSLFHSVMYQLQSTQPSVFKKDDRLDNFIRQYNAKFCDH